MSEHTVVSAAREALLDALEALAAHRDAIVVIGAQAVYLRTVTGSTRVPPFTRDVDLGVDITVLGDHPRIEEALERAGFVANANGPGSWTSPTGVHTDLMAPSSVVLGGRRSVPNPPHNRMAVRQTPGIEGILSDRDVIDVRSLGTGAPRSAQALVAGPAALIVAKAIKIEERRHGPDRRLVDKDAHDILRILQVWDTAALVTRMKKILDDPRSRDMGDRALAELGTIFANDQAPGSRMVKNVERGVGDPEIAASAAVVLTGDFRSALRGGA